MKTILDVRWYYYLNSKSNSPIVKEQKNIGLLDHYSRNSLKKSLLVCWDFFDETTKKVNKLYTVFNNYINFAMFYFRIPIHLRCFYEIILGENFQKPHFDIDMENENIELANRVLSDVILAIHKIIPELNYQRDILIYSSHDFSQNKISYHLIINNYCHSNNMEAKAFHQLILSNLPENYKKWIDGAVYSKTQQFRILGCTKYGKNRYKKLEENFSINGINYKHIFEDIDELNSEKDEKDEKNEEYEKRYFLMTLEESLISARLSKCKILPAFSVVQESQIFKDSDIDLNLAISSIELLAKSMGVTMNDDRFPYKLDHVTGSFVILKRIKPSKCKICQRVHHHQNPYLLVYEDSGYVFFHCRRAASQKKLYIGCLETENGPEKIDVKIMDSNVNSEINSKVNSEINLEKIQNTWIESTLKKLQNVSKQEFAKISKEETKETKRSHISNSERDIDPNITNIITDNIKKKILEKK